MDRLRAKLNATILHDKVRPVQSTAYTFKGSISYEGKEDIIDLLCSCIEERARGRNLPLPLLRRRHNLRHQAAHPG